MTPPQRISAGDESVNLQAAGSVYVGMQYSEIRQMCLDLFELNYDRLLGDARVEAERRAAEVVDAFLQELRSASPEAVKNLADPGVQRALIQAEFDHASTGDPDAPDLYARLLMHKLAHPGKDVTSIACQQAVEVVSQLTQRHIDLLSCIFVVLKVSFQGAITLDHLRARYASTLKPVAYAISNNHEDLRYLDSVSCLAFDTTRSYNVQRIMKETYADVLQQEVDNDKDIVDCVSEGHDDVRAVLNAFSAGEGFLSSCFLSPRGVAVAHANLSRRIATLPPLSVWVH